MLKCKLSVIIWMPSVVHFPRYCWICILNKKILAFNFQWTLKMTLDNNQAIAELELCSAQTQSLG